MNKLVLSLASFLVIIGLVANPMVATAQSVDATAPVLNLVKQRCSTLKTSVKQIHTSDAVMRVNSGQSYNALSSKLMAKFNGRVSLNRLDGTKLVRITNDFEKLRTQFSNNYNSYDTAMSELEGADCQADPASYYKKLIAAREARNRLPDDIKALNELIVKYRHEVSLLRDSIAENGS